MRTEKENDPLAELRLYALHQTGKIYIILVDGTVCAGFPSPADDYFQSRIDLNEELIRNPDATFGIWVQGNSMQDDGIENGDFLLVDRSVLPSDNSLAICVLNNEFTIKRIEKKGNRIRLLPANAAFPPIVVQEGDELIIWGIVTYVIKKP
ncbi:MAG: translesion error-prone DNA polymerase V autoproteolytic subunit [Bacteroidetes bacterium]|jgi:DNA polymerase V|nr:translesion error-prone DNA polymerase V autoproteolytic subunit [Bacteroidota bacterium]